jgi:hypothetical protein
MGKRFEQQPDYARYKTELGWYEKVISPRMCEYHQADELVSKSWFESPVWYTAPCSFDCY